jgi:uncharacterized membrane protein HdeD (DUF308 family)
MTMTGGGVAAQPRAGRPAMLDWGGTWQALIVAGLGLLALGVVLLVWPRATIVVVAALVGAALLVTGVLRLVQGLTAKEESGARRTAYVMIGILAALAGLYSLRHIDMTVAVLGVVVGLLWTIHGIVDLAVAASPRHPAERVLTALLGVLSLAAGLLLVFWPAETLKVLVTVMGIWLICYGVLLALMAYEVHRIPAAADPLLLTTEATIPPQQAGPSDPLRPATQSGQPGSTG